MSESVHIVAIVTLAPEHVARIEPFLARIITESRKEAGCRHYVINRDLEKAGRFTTDEHWVSAAAFQTHLESPHFQEIAAELKAVDADLQILKVRPLDAAADAD